MTLLLDIHYSTHIGEDLRVNIRRSDGSYMQHNMQTSDGHVWKISLNIEDTAEGHVDYFYSLHRMSSELRREWCVITHRLETVGNAETTYVCHDVWYDIPEDSYLYSSAFTECINHREHMMSPKADSNNVLRLKLRAPQLRKGERLFISGNCSLLGNWNTDDALPMYEHENNEWATTLDTASIMHRDVEFKFIIKDIDGNGDDNVLWETGNNRHIHIPDARDNEITVIELPRASFDIPGQKLAGTAVPVFSLRSEGSFGVGDFGDLKLMTDWVAATGQRILQVLPINDTTLDHSWQDSYPYSCISIFALHPMYCDLRQLPQINDTDLRTGFEHLREELNALPKVDYVRVNDAKNEYLHIIFEQEGKRIFGSKEFKEWFKEEEAWLVPYAQYCVLRERFHTPDYNDWADHNVWNEDDRAQLTNPRTKAYKEAAYYYFLQYVLAQQMKEAHRHARERNVILKGDIPIGVNRCGCDAWMEPRYFNLNGQAGAPPDFFSSDGQNWGFPTYNWDEMLKDNCAWWVRRFSNMAKYFDAYRIDHVLGFFRIWEIPVQYKFGLLGQFAPALGLTVEEIAGYGLTFSPDMLCEEGDDEREIAGNALFLRDHKKPGLYHPRISSYGSPRYERLSQQEKDSYNALYDDYFYHRNNHFWYTEAMKKLPRLVNATRMLVCAEDLGMVPDCVPWVMDELKILSLEIQSMPKESFVRFGRLSRNPYRSVCTISSHDTATLRMWWDEDHERTADYYRNSLHRDGEAPHPLPGWLAKDIIYRHLTCPSMLCILTLQDWLATDEQLRLADADEERINIPANPHHYWRYRMHINIEQLLAEKDFNNSLKEMIESANR